MKGICTLVCCFGLYLMCGAQEGREVLRQRLEGKQTLQEVMSEVDAIYDGREEVAGLPKYKHWARRAWWWSRHLNADGTAADVHQMNARAIKTMERQESDMRTTNGLWSSIGPVQSSYANNGNFCAANGYGRIDRIAFHPTNASTIYVGAPYGGLWKTTDAGDTWICLTDGLPQIGVGGIVVSHDDPDDIYILSGTGDDRLGAFVDANGFFNVSDGIYKSTNGGGTWQRIFSFPIEGTRSHRMKQHPSDENTIFALTDTIVYRTEDSGLTWDSIFQGAYTDIEFHPTDHDTIYISGFARYSYSQDKGDTWTMDSTINFCGLRAELAVSPQFPDRVWMLAGNGFLDDGIGNSYCGLFRSTDSGESFSLINNQPDILSTSSADQSNYDLVVAVSPTNSNIVLAGAITLWRNANGGIGLANWINVCPYWQDSIGSLQGTLPTNYVHPDVHDLAFNPLDNQLYCAGDGGIYVSADQGVNWTNITEGIVTSQIYHINGSLSTSSRLLIGLQDNGVKMRTSATSEDFQHINSGDGYEVVIDPTNNNRVVATLNARCYMYPSFSGTSRTRIFDGNGFFKPVRFRPGGGDTIYVGHNGALNVVQLSTLSITALNDGSSASWCIETCPDNNSRIYFAGGGNGFRADPNGSFYTSFNNGASSFDRMNTPGFPDTLQIITDIAVYPNQCGRVAFAMGGYIDGNKVYYSTSSGASWTNISYNLPNVPVFSIAIDAAGNFYAGTEIGVFVKEETATEWIPFTNGLPRVPVSGLVVQEGPGLLIASTFGRGVWESPLYTSCPIARSISGDLPGQRAYHASQSITSDASLEAGVGTDVLYQAGNYLRLEPGFIVVRGGRFLGVLDDCPN